MNIEFVLVTLLVLLLIAYHVIRSRVPVRSVETQELPGTMPAKGNAREAVATEDLEATLVFRRSALKAPEARGGGADVRERQPRLIGMSQEVRGMTICLQPTGAIIGRAPDNQIRVTDPRVSQRHAWVGVVHDKAMVCDLKSTNGTFLNTATDAPITEAELKHNDTVLLGGHGGTQFRFVID